MNYQDAVAYFRACYLADNKELTIRDLFAKSVELLWQIEGDDEVLAGNMVLYPIPDAYATDVAKVLKVYEKEKELLYFSFLLLGHDPQAQLKLAAPVFLFTANLGQDAQGSSVCIERDNPKLNVGVLRLIAEQTDAQTDLSSVVFEELAGLADYGLVDGVFARNFPHTDIAPVLEYPKLHGAEQVASLLKEVFQCKELVLKLVPAAGFFVHNKSGDTLGVLNELADLSAATDFSDPLRALFGTDLPLPKPLPLGDVPAILSAAQHRILESAARFPLSLVVGPPGTGKSYTVAALAIEHLTKGQTVLVVSRTDKAVDVIAHKIKHEFLLPNAVVRAGRSQYLRDLKDSIQSLLSGQSLADCPSKKQISAIAHDVNRLKTCIRKAEVSFLKRAAREKQWGRFLASCPNGQAASIWTRFRKSYIRNRVQNRQYLWALSGQLETDFDTLVSKIRSLVAAKHLARTHQMLKNHRKQLGNLYKALGARTGTKKEEYFGMIDFEVLLGTFPIWLLNMKDIYKALPLQKDLFDLAIIDEATQCDIAACLPIFQRAKRVVVTGDPKQLRHISFLAGAVQGHLMARYNLKASGKDSDFFDYRNQSILDVVADRLVSQQQVSFLNEHFRSVPSIIRFSNEAFYNNSLHIMTQKPAHKALNTGIALRPCQGTRHKDGYNTTEAQN
ncbi:MAG: hypothetical protein RIS47_152, partial [Bacteroidota bacterium]